MRLPNPLARYREARAAQRLKQAIREPLSLVMPVGMGGVYSSTVTDDTYLDAYEINPWVYACVHAIATAVASAPIVVERQVNAAQDEWEEATEAGGLNGLLEHINADDSTYMFLEGLTAGVALHGNGYALLLRPSDSAPPAAMQIIPSNVVEVMPGKGKRSSVIKGYKITLGSGRTQFVNDIDMLHVKLFSPKDTLVGQPPTKALEVSINAFNAVAQFSYQFMKRGGLPAGLFESETRLTEEQQRQLKAQHQQWRSPTSGDSSLVLEGGLKWTPVGISPDQVLALQYPARLREEICACYGVPPALVGVYEDADYANARAQRKLFWEETVSDYLLLLAGAINEQLAWQFQGGPWRVRFDLSGIEALQEDKELAATRRREDVRAGLRTINEVRKEEGLEPVPWGDVWWGPLSTIPLAGPEGAENVPQAVTPAPAEPEPKPEEDAPAEEEDEEEAAPKASPILSIKAAPKRLSPAVRRRVSLAFNRQRAAYIPPIREGVGGWYDDLAKEVLANLRAANPAPVRAKDPQLATLLFNVVDAGNQLFAMLKPIISDEADETGRAMLETLAIDIPFNMPSARLEELLAKRDFAMRTVAQDAHDRVYASLAEGLANSENMQQLTERVLEFAIEGKEQYAETVARTEAGIAANEASREAYWQADAVGLEWVAVGDDKTRDSHAAMNGTTVVRGEMFDLDGTPCTGPGDPDLPAEEICNCRCTVCPVF